MTTKRSAMTIRALQYRNDEGFAMAVVISVVLIMFIMLAAVTLPLTADVQSSIRLGKVANERQLAESVMNELFSQAAKSSDLNLGFRMVGRVNPKSDRSVDDAGDTAGWAKYVPATGSFEACGSITDPCFFYSPQITSGSPFVTVEVTTRSACRADKTSCVFRRFQQTWRRRGFVDYVIFTDMETLQPELYGTGVNALKVRRGTEAEVPVDAEWAKFHCGDRYKATVAIPSIATPWPDGTKTARLDLFDNSRRQTSNVVSPLPNRYLWPYRLNNDPLNAHNLATDEAAADATLQPDDRRHENCFEIAYTGYGGAADLDKISGPIHTNDYWFWFCGTPQFNDKVEATGDPAVSSGLAQIFKPSTMSGCKAAGQVPKQADGVTDFATYAPGPFLKLPDKLGNYADIAQPQYTFAPTLGQRVRIRMLPNRQMQVTLNGDDPKLQPLSSAIAVPSRGVVRMTSSPVPTTPYVLEIDGEGSDVTFVSEDDLTVTGDIKDTGTAGVTLGFVAAGSITINQTDRSDIPRKDRNVDGAFLSLKGMSVQDWNLTSDAGKPHPTLHLKGAIIARYRPVFGTYDKDGQLQSGMRKDIKYPTDSKTAQIPPTPPYFVQPVNAVWVRLDFTETPLLAGTPGLTKAPTSPPGTALGGGCDKLWPTTADVLAGQPINYVPLCLVS
jgi:hypothetical protein